MFEKFEKYTRCKGLFVVIDQPGFRVGILPSPYQKHKKLINQAEQAQAGAGAREQLPVTCYAAIERLIINIM
jgi:hypothetical protein